MSNQKAFLSRVFELFGDCFVPPMRAASDTRAWGWPV